jgi:hypothetical protein
MAINKAGDKLTIIKNRIRSLASLVMIVFSLWMLELFIVVPVLQSKAPGMRISAILLSILLLGICIGVTVWRIRFFKNDVSHIIELKNENLFVDGIDHGALALIQVTIYYTLSRFGEKTYTVFLRSTVTQKKIRLAVYLSQKDAFEIKRYFDGILDEDIEFRRTLWV